MKRLRDLFLKHPDSIGETYIEHFIYAAKTSILTAKISIIIMLHAFFPFICEATASEMISKLSEDINKRKEGCEMKEFKDVAAIVVLEGEKFLILRRSKTSTGSGFWNFPGGKVDPEEEIDSAAVRELKEEAGLVVGVKDIEYLGTMEIRNLRVHFHITDTYEGTVTINKESDDFKWITIDELSENLFVGGGSLLPELIESMEKYMENRDK